MRIIILALFICACQAARGPENCRAPQLTDGFFVPKLEIHEDGVQISYGCNKGLKPDLETWWGDITCNNGKWSHTPRCIDKTWCISTLVPNAKPDVLEASPPGEVSLECAPGYEFKDSNSKANCEAGTWTLPECIRPRRSCAPPPRVLNGMITTPYSSIFQNRDSVEYICARGYKLIGNKMITCTQGTWSPVPSCVEAKCDPPRVPNAEPTQKLLTYPSGITVSFKCNTRYVFEGTDTAKCEDGTWQLPVCKDPTSCSAPDVPNAKPSGQLKSLYKDRDYVTFVCDGGYEFENEYYATCEGGTWKLPVCKRTWCPAPEVPNGRPTEWLKESYNNGDYVSFACNSGYELEKRDSYATCQGGTWKLPVCKAPPGTPCTDTPDVPNAQPAAPLSPYAYPTGRTVRFICNSGYEFEGTNDARCEDGTWRLPVCKRAGGGGGGILLPVRVCGSQPLVENGDVTELPGGMELKVQCARYYKLSGPATVGCVNGEWTELPVCIPPCKVEGKRIQPKQEDDYLPEGQEKKYPCGRVYKVTVRCLKGQTLYGQCTWNG